MALVNSPTQAKIVVNGVDVTSYALAGTEGTKDYTEAVGTATIVLSRAVTSALTISNSLIGTIVTWQRGVNSPTEYYRFRGVVVSVDQAANQYTLNCRNKYYLAQVREFTTSYDINIDTEAGVISAIFQDIVNSYTPLSATNASIQNSGTSYVLNKFVGRHSQCYERLDDLAEALNWQHYYNDYDDLVYFEPRGFVDSGTTLQVGVNVVESPVFTTDASKLVNSLTVLGATQSVQSTMFFDGNNTNGQKFVLSFPPTSMKVYVGSGAFTPSTGNKPSNNSVNLRAGGQINSTAGSFDYNYDADENVKTVYFYDPSRGTQPSYVPPSGTSNVEIQYTYDWPAPVLIKRQSSIDTYGLREKTLTKDDIKNVSDAETYASNYLDRFSVPFTTAVLKVTGVSDIHPGRTYTVIDSAKGINTSLIATKLKFFYPYKPDEVTVGDDVSLMYDIPTDILDRVKRLEEQQDSNTELLVQLFSEASNFAIENRYAKVQWDDYSGVGVNDFFVGNVKMGILGTDKLGLGAAPVSTVIRLVPGENEYQEFVLDTEFYDNVNSSGVTWDTSAKTITITSGTLYTNYVALGVQYTTAFLSVANMTGSTAATTFYISADGKSTWQTLPLNTLTTLSGTNTSGVYLKVVCTFGSVVINNTYNDDLSLNLPAITLQLN